MTDTLTDEEKQIVYEEIESLKNQLMQEYGQTVKNIEKVSEFWLPKIGKQNS